jgi:hypothetical protein
MENRSPARSPSQAAGMLELFFELAQACEEHLRLLQSDRLLDRDSAETVAS